MTDTTTTTTSRPTAGSTAGCASSLANSLDTNTPQTPGMNRAAAINAARVGAQKIWAGTVHIHANAKTGRAPPRSAGERDLRA